MVFVGVYAAFAVESRERQRDADTRRAQLEAALVREIDSITRTTRNAAAGTAKMIDAYESAWAAGRMPALRPMIEPIRVQTHMWEATLQSGGLDLFDVAIVFQLSQFYNALNAGFEQLEQLRQLSESMLLPRLDEPVERFYDAATGRPREQYGWYIAGIKNLRQEAELITTLGEQLLGTLKPPAAASAPRQ